MTLIFSTLLLVTALCHGQFEATGPGTYSWSNVTQAADYPTGYNYPVFVFGDWMVAMNKGAWLSNNGKRWVKTDLPESGLNSAHQKYLRFNGAIYSLGSMTGNYERFSIDTTIRRTRDFKTWETVATSSNLPKRVFYGAAVFGNRMWIMGGYDGNHYLNDVWSSADGVHWEQEVKTSPWTPRNATTVAVFQNKLWLFGGGVIDGDTDTNRNSNKEVWNSADGREWKLVKTNIDKKWGGTPVVYDDKLWLVGMNRGNAFASALWYTEDGRIWKEAIAPWSPRGAVAAWVHNGKLFMTGGKSSHTENGQVRFVYSNDVWSMERSK